MKTIVTEIVLLLLTLYLAQSEAAVVRGIFQSPAHPGKCVINPNIILNEFQTIQYPSMECARIICDRNSQVLINTCDAQSAPPGCTFGQQKQPDANYPVCCQREIVCNNLTDK